MITLSKFTLYYNTVKYLKPVQVFNRVSNKIKKRVRFKLYSDNPKSNPLTYPFYLQNENSINGKSFHFLNLTKDFHDKVDWNFSDYGRLWTYNLNYFDFINQKDITKKDGIKIIHEYITNFDSLKDGLDPYPTSLRILNWIKFISLHNVEDKEIDRYLYSQLKYLSSIIEYHLLGNHLLENAFALLQGSYYFKDERIYLQANNILKKELKEQITADGAHFELSPMYHSIILSRTLDGYGMVSLNNIFNDELESILKDTVSKMTSWLNTITFRNGMIPLFNDAAYKIAPSPDLLFKYASVLGVDNKAIKLSDSGFRKYSTNKFELVLDVGKVGPDYQPGHAHADTFNFDLHINGRPVIVETGTSTYELNETRKLERSTSAHNTVEVNGMNSSQVWAGHRVGNRAKVKIIKESENFIKAIHDGYKHLSCYHTRSFQLKENEIEFIDEVTTSGIAYFHFQPNEKIILTSNRVIGKDFMMEFGDHEEIIPLKSHYSPEFNKVIERECISVKFKCRLTTIIK